MRVAMVGLFPEPGKAITGGVERVIATLMPKLAEREKVCLFVPGASVDRVVHDGAYPIVYTRRAQGPGIFRYWTVDAWRLRRPILDFKPDIIHVQGMAGFNPGLDIPSIFTLHGVVDRDLLASQRSRWAGRISRLIAAKLLRAIEDCSAARIGNAIVINRYVLEDVPIIARQQYFEICNPIEEVYCETPLPQPSQQRKRNIVSVGRIGTRKNTLEIVQIAALVLREDPEAKLILCGAADNANYLAACKRAVAEQNVADRVEFRGNLSVGELIDVYDQSSCLLMTSHQETAPLAISEATTRGLCVVAPRAFGIKYMVDEGRNGFFLPTPGAGNAASAKIVRQALDHTWDRSAISANARSTFSPDAVTAATIAAYRRVIDFA